MGNTGSTPHWDENPSVTCNGNRATFKAVLWDMKEGTVKECKRLQQEGLRGPQVPMINGAPPDLCERCGTHICGVWKDREWLSDFGSSCTHENVCRWRSRCDQTSDTRCNECCRHGHPNNKCTADMFRLYKG